MKKWHIPCKIAVTDFEERQKGEPSELVRYNAEGKAQIAALRFPDALVIGVDTIGVIGKRILTKPVDMDDARKMLKRLSGSTHEVLTGLTLIYKGKKKSVVVRTGLKFRKVSAAEIEKYLGSGQWKGKAGAYAIQGRAKGFLDEIEGDFTNVVGLPMPTLIKMLKAWKVV
ncbi:septum formation protein Maf [Candidatus Gracilibacteria bacterium]|nr:septum formation protein Maf [Candidatus Gracilibacteria bacterium]